MSQPTLDQIKDEARSLTSALGSGVHLRVTELMLSLDSRYPGMTDEQFAAVREQAEPVVAEIRSKALHQMWGAE